MTLRFSSGIATIFFRVVRKKISEVKNMSITNEQKQKHLEQRRYFYAASPNYHIDKTAMKEQLSQQTADQKRRKKLLDYLNNAKKSAIKRGMFNQKPYSKTVSEAENNV